MKTSDRVAQAPPAPSESQPPLRARRIGIAAGLAAISCCVYPIVLYLLGLAAAAEAVALGNRLFGVWGWAFKLGGGALAVTAVVFQLRKRGQCSVRGARANWTFLARVAGIGVAVYFIVYAATKALGEWAA